MADSSDHLQRFRTRFASGLPDRLRRLRAHWSDAGREGVSADAIRAFHREAHNLAGSSAAFGYPSLQRVADELLRMAREMAEGEGPAAFDRSRVAACIDALEAAAAEDEQRMERG